MGFLPRVLVVASLLFCSFFSLAWVTSCIVLLRLVACYVFVFGVVAGVVEWGCFLAVGPWCCVSLVLCWPLCPVGASVCRAAVVVRFVMARVISRGLNVFVVRPRSCWLSGWCCLCFNGFVLCFLRVRVLLFFVWLFLVALRLVVFVGCFAFLSGLCVHCVLPRWVVLCLSCCQLALFAL